MKNHLKLGTVLLNLLRGERGEPRFDNVAKLRRAANGEDEAGGSRRGVFGDEKIPFEEEAAGLLGVRSAIISSSTMLQSILYRSGNESFARLDS